MIKALFFVLLGLVASQDWFSMFLVCFATWYVMMGWRFDELIAASKMGRGGFSKIFYRSGWIFLLDNKAYLDPELPEVVKSLFSWSWAPAIKTPEFVPSNNSSTPVNPESAEVVRAVVTTCSLPESNKPYFCFCYCVGTAARTGMIKGVRLPLGSHVVVRKTGDKSKPWEFIRTVESA